MAHIKESMVRQREITNLTLLYYLFGYSGYTAFETYKIGTVQRLQSRVK